MGGLSLHFTDARFLWLDCAGFDTPSLPLLPNLCLYVDNGRIRDTRTHGRVGLEEGTLQIRHSSDDRPLAPFQEQTFTYL